ncbi:hypothetical protein DN069_09550 [Streptacidiphilus pinicola]|uniref:Secreted protein n=1 Tax=Streptacidiphilus pinicola TaxID=2219663 RepID=A0A2X0J623_9ACTN|nr:hypothetical protein [Streptacidiphilus pinicola]RAG85746.1 hypothetical protein DN069_09550 [Streptacidiphilus pinicola]
MVSSKCGRLLAAAGLPAAALGLTLAAGGAASAAPIALPATHVVNITADASCDGHSVVSTQAHTQGQHSLPGAMPAVDTIRPVFITPEKGPQTRPEHPIPQHGMTDPLEAEKHDSVKIHVFHQVVLLKIETTEFTITVHRGSERGH